MLLRMGLRPEGGPASDSRPQTRRAVAQAVEQPAGAAAARPRQADWEGVQVVGQEAGEAAAPLREAAAPLREAAAPLREAVAYPVNQTVALPVAVGPVAALAAARHLVAKPLGAGGAVVRPRVAAYQAES